MTSIITHQDIDPEVIQVGSRLRELNRKKVETLKKSIQEIGLQVPVDVWIEPRGDDSIAHLVAGLHRVTAARELGLGLIECRICALDKIDREIWEIDENLCRAELTPAEEAEHLKRRKELFDQKNSVSICDTNNGRGRPKGFDTDIAEKTGGDRKSINRKRTRAEKIVPDVLEDIKGTDLDKGVFFDKIKKLDPEQQRLVVDRVKDLDEAPDEAIAFVRGEKPHQGIDPLSAQTQYRRLVDLWDQSDESDREQFREYINCTCEKEAF